MGSTDYSPFFATFTEDECGVVVVLQDRESPQQVSYQIETFDLVQQSDLISQHPAQLYYSVSPFLPSEGYLAHQ